MPPLRDVRLVVHPASCSPAGQPLTRIAIALTCRFPSLFTSHSFYILVQSAPKSVRLVLGMWQRQWHPSLCTRQATKHCSPERRTVLTGQTSAPFSSQLQPVSASVCISVRRVCALFGNTCIFATPAPHDACRRTMGYARRKCLGARSGAKKKQSKGGSGAQEPPV